MDVMGNGNAATATATDANAAQATGATQAAAVPADSKLRENFEYNRKYFAPGERAQAEELLQRLINGRDPANPNGLRANVSKDNPAGDPVNVVLYGYKGATKVAEWPEGAGVQLLPLSRNVPAKKVEGQTEEAKAQRKHFGLLAWPFYPLDQVMNAKDGAQFIADLWTASQADLTLQPLRGTKVALELLGTMQKVKRSDGTEEMVPYVLDDALDSVPKSLADYLAIGSQERGIMKPFNELGPDLLDQLKKTYKSLSPINLPVFRQLLSVKAIAMQMFGPLEERGLFVKLLNILANAAVQKGMSREVFDNWLRDRDTATAQTDTADDDDAALAKLSIG